MKKVLVLVLVSAVSLLGHAEDVGKDHPCHDVKMACEAAGFAKGHHKHEGKGLWMDCVNKLKAGETVPGVTVAADKIEACKAKMAEKKAK